MSADHEKTGKRPRGNPGLREPQSRLQSSLGSYWLEPSTAFRSHRSFQPSGGEDNPTREDPRRENSKEETLPSSSLPATTPSTASGEPEPAEDIITIMSSQRSRPRGPNRSTEAGGHGEELHLWEDVKKLLGGTVSTFNESSSNVLAIRDQEKVMAEKKEKGTITMEDYTKLDNLLRRGVKTNDAAGQNIATILEQINILKAVAQAKEQELEQSSSRTGAARIKETVASSSVYDFDGAGDSPVPSPNPTVRGRVGTSSKDGRESVPPNRGGTPAAKAGSVEPQTGNAAGIIRSKVTFAKDDEVAFKPKPVNNEHTDWILGFVQEVRGEGKARRYKVLDAEPDEHGVKKDFRTSASSMIHIPKEGTVLPPLETGKTVLAMYPDSTTFYKAEVQGMAPDGKVNLKFDGDESIIQAVFRRYVVEYRG